jgi:AcrR family transcriptional regulator
MSTTGMPQRPMRADARRNYERLLAEARVVFTEQGVGAPLEEIARRAGVGIGTLYRHFPTREALMEAVYSDQVEALAQRAYDLSAVLPPDEAMMGWLRGVAEQTSSRLGLIAALKAVLDLDSGLFDACHARMRGAAEALLAHGRDAGTVRADVTSIDLLRLAHGLAVATEKWPDSYDRLLKIMMDGLRPRKP